MLSAEEIAAKLKKIRLKKFGEKGIREFARQSGVSRGSVGPIENCDGDLMLDTFRKWLKACEVTFADFFNEPNPENPYAAKFKEFHDDLEFVLSVRGPRESSTVRTLCDETALIIIAQNEAAPKSRDPSARPQSGRRAGAPHDVATKQKRTGS